MSPLRELSRLLARHTAPAPRGTWQSESLGLRLSAASSTGQPTQQVYDPVFALVVQGEKQLLLGDKLFSCQAGSSVVVSVDLPLTFQVSRASPEKPYLALALALKPAAVASLLLEAESAPTLPVRPEATGLGVSDAPEDLLESVVRLVRLLDQPRDLAVLGPLAIKEILWRLLCSEQGYRLRQIGLAESHLSQIGRAMRWMRDNYGQALSIEELARISGMSVTSFHRHFRAVALMSPLRYLKQIRLQQARVRLLARTEDVATVGHAVGYDSASQFSREYKRAFGSPPGQDARLLRAANGKRQAAASSK